MFKKLLSIILASALVIAPVQQAEAFFFGGLLRSKAKRAVATNPVSKPVKKAGLPKPKPKSIENAKERYNKAQSHERAKRTADNADKPLEPSNSKKAKVGHGHAEHGYQTTAKQQKERIGTGKKPSGAMDIRPAKTASKFSSPQLEAEALRKGEKALQQKLKAGNIPNFKKNGEPNRVTVIVPSSNKDGFGQSWTRKLDNNGNPMRDKNGNYVSEKNSTPLKNALITYEYVPSQKTWNPVTYYPK